MRSGILLTLPLLLCIVYCEALNSSEWSTLSEPRRKLALASCNLFNGSWIYDAPLYNAAPRYNGNTCPFELNTVNCQKQGRPDRFYRLYSFQPHQCYVPRFNPHTFLNLMRGRTIAVVGDSIARWNFYSSFMCQLYQVVKPVRSRRPLVPGTTAEEYIIEQYGIRLISIADAFLVASSSDPKILAYYGGTAPKGSDNNVVGVTRFPNPVWGKYINKFDVLVMETGHHWLRAKTRQRFFVDGAGHLLPNQDPIHALGVSLLTIRNYFQARRASGPIPIFLTATPQHGAPRGRPAGTLCGFPYRTPLNSAQVASLERTNPDYTLYHAVQAAALRASPVQLMDITAMSLARPDGHVGPWYIKGGVLTPKSPFQDCLHWCNPGVPDVWSDLFLALLQRQPRLRRRRSSL